MTDPRRLFWSILSALAVAWVGLPLAKWAGALPWSWSTVLAPGYLMAVGLLLWWTANE